jgi:hypothetical protein
MDAGIRGDEFDDVELPTVDDLEEDRFSFLENDQWSELVSAKVAPRTLIKLRFVNALFEDWRSRRNRHHSDTSVPEKGICEFTEEEYNM